jgi:hypothetical protein
MTSLDHHTAPSPPSWTADRVRDRLVEAFLTEKKMPGQRFTKVMPSSWPVTPLHEFADRVYWTDERERVWQSWEHAKGADAIEVTRMEEAQAWLSWLPRDELQCLDAWAKCEAFGIPVAKAMRRIGFKKTTFYRKRDDASQRIACRLDREGVQVR